MPTVEAGSFSTPLLYIKNAAKEQNIARNAMEIHVASENTDGMVNGENSRNGSISSAPKMNT